MTDIFKDGQTQPQEAPVSSSESKPTDELTKLSKRVQDSQEHISKIERENAELREKLKSAKSIEDVLEKLHKPDPIAQPVEEVKPNLQPQPDFKKIVQDELTQLEMQRLVRDNAQTVANALRKRFGDKAESEFNAKAKELDMSAEQLHVLASTSPKAVLGMFETKLPAPSQASSSINTESILNLNKYAASHSKNKELMKDYMNTPSSDQKTEIYQKLLEQEMAAQ